MNLELITKIEHQKIQNEIISKIRELINFKNLEPGDKLPSERMLSGKFDVSRSAIREAIQKLEYYGLLKSIPQSGTLITDIGIIALNGIVDNILRLKQPDFKSLVETRILLEMKAIELAAERRTEYDLSQIKKTLDAYRQKATDGENAVQEDLLFHLAIAEASGNTSLISLMLIITPEIITNFDKHHVCDEDRTLSGIQEHIDIYEAIKAQDYKIAKERLKIHFRFLYQYCNNTQDIENNVKKKN